MKCDIDKKETVSFNKKEKGEERFCSGTLGSTKEWMEYVRREDRGDLSEKDPPSVQGLSCGAASLQSPEIGRTKSALDGNWEGIGYLDVDPSQGNFFLVCTEPET